MVHPYSSMSENDTLVLGLLSSDMAQTRHPGSDVAVDILKLRLHPRLDRVALDGRASVPHRRLDYRSYMDFILSDDVGDTVSSIGRLDC